MSFIHSTSAYDGTDITVSDILKDPTWIQEVVTENLDGAFLENALFRNGGSNDGVVAYREAASRFLNDGPSEIAEFGEIPVADLNLGEAKTLIGHKVGVAVRISREMQRENKIDQVSLRVQALQNTMVQSGVEATLAAFNAADVPSVQVSTAWDDADANPMLDIRVAKRAVAAAKAPNDPDALMGYRPDTIVVGPGTMDLALFHDSVQRFYNGNAALENPVFQGITPGVLAGLRVIESAWFPEGEALVMQSGVAGFISDTDPLTVTPLYEEGGASGYGGPRQSWRADAFRKRVIAVDNPKSVVRLTGIGTV